MTQPITAKDVLASLDAWQTSLPRKAEPQPQQHVIALPTRATNTTLAQRLVGQVEDLDMLFRILMERAAACTMPEQIDLLGRLALRCQAQAATSTRILAECGLLQSLAAGAKTE
jgi:hypothetical protein